MPHPVTDSQGPVTLAAAEGIVIPVTASPHGLRGLAGFRDWLASFRTEQPSSITESEQATLTGHCRKGAAFEGPAE